jgi:flagellar hook-length control protein FliK
VASLELPPTPSQRADQTSAAGNPPENPTRLGEATATLPLPAAAPPAPPIPIEVPTLDTLEAPAPTAPTTDHKNGPGAAAADSPPLQLAGASPLEMVAPFAAPAATPTITATASPAPAHSTNAAAPSEQIAPALLTLAKTADGSQKITIRLQPIELGMVQVRIERASSGSTLVEIITERSDTLRAMQQDQPQLHHVLDEAGIPAAGRTFTFHVAQPAQPSSGNSGSGQGGGQGTEHHSTPGRMNSGNTSDGSAGGSGKGGYPTREASSWSGGRRRGGSSVTAGANSKTAEQSYHIGLDITA